ncbi:conserved hypothetical protein [Verticillium alfalfae VaMs.102]|uniref:Gamma-glutamylcyclotransferase AIG2-like domain-containing protein n=1 Tax=Verticillium alfalfae (strain VaMs.102 / ATCC MYA-4576 / FGSC 10136) TaxID=526221 RepID=C9SPF5_VERA1|nr:conserved hypothetical protein [Verticillium alfalfae VaMs.102]EEY20670.1 conserved hypothetical protein [Verticillium alfalfae VaMs.102]
MKSRCPASTPVGLAFLPAPWEWLINERGYANVVYRRSDNKDTTGTSRSTATGTGVYGVLYRLPPADEELLDGYEGVPIAYEKVTLPVVVFAPGEQQGPGGGHEAEALVYVNFHRVGKGESLDEYVGRMNRGISEATEAFGLPGWYVDKVMRPFIPLDEPTAVS